MAKTADKTLISTPFPSTDRVAKKFNLPKRRVQRVEGMMELLQKKKAGSTKGSKKAGIDVIDRQSKQPGTVSKVLIRKNKAGLFVIELNIRNPHGFVPGGLLRKNKAGLLIELNSQKHPLGSKALKEILNDMRADGLGVKRSVVGVQIGPAKTQTDARMIANKFFKMAHTKDSQLPVRPPKRTGASGIKEFAKKSE